MAGIVLDRVPFRGASLAARRLSRWDQPFSAATTRVREHPADLREALFGPRPLCEALIARVGGQPAGFAIWFFAFSTFRGRPNLCIEDLYVRPAFRRLGVGRAVAGRLAVVAQLAHQFFEICRRRSVNRSGEGRSQMTPGGRLRMRPWQIRA